MVCPVVNDLFITDTLNQRIVRREPINLDYVSEDNFGGNLSTARGICVDSDYLYVSDTSNNAILKLNISDYSYEDTFGADSLRNPYGICQYGEWIYFVSYGWVTTGHRVFAFKKDNSEFIEASGYGTGDDQQRFAQGICTDGTYVYVCDTGNNRIVKRLCSDLSFDSKIGTVGTGNDNFTQPKAIGTYNGKLYIGDNASRSRLMVRLCTDLSFESSKILYGSIEYQTRQITSLCVSPYNLYLTDDIGCKIQKRKLSTLGYVSMVGIQNTAGSGDNEFNYPQGIAVQIL